MYSTSFGTMDEPISRRLAQDQSFVTIISVLQQECTRASCPEMKTGEWLYLCVAHGNDGDMVYFVHITTSTVDMTSRFSPGKHCCPIDYILHTGVDSATALLNSPRTFPSRYDTVSIFNLYTLYNIYIHSFSPDSRFLSRLIGTFPH